MSTYCNIKKEFCSKNSTQAILQSNNTSLIISLMFISPWIALVLFKPFHVVLKCIFSMQHIFEGNHQQKNFFPKWYLKCSKKTRIFFFNDPNFSMCVGKMWSILSIHGLGVWGCELIIWLLALLARGLSVQGVFESPQHGITTKYVWMSQPGTN